MKQKYKHITVTQLSHGTKTLLLELAVEETIGIIQTGNTSNSVTRAVAAIIPYEMYMKWQRLIFQLTERIKLPESEEGALINALNTVTKRNGSDKKDTSRSR